MPKSILLCDDEIHILRAAEIKFRRGGYDVRLANDGQEAWEEIQARIPDLLITDCQMPRLGGLQLVEKLREREATKDLSIIMLTGKGFELDRQRLFTRWRVSTVLAKPFSPRELFRLAEELLNPAPQENKITIVADDLDHGNAADGTASSLPSNTATGQGA